VTRLSPDQTCAVCGSLLVPPELASGVKVPKGADYVCLKCGREYRWTDDIPPRLAPVAVDSTGNQHVPEADHSASNKQLHLHRKASSILILEDDTNTLESYSRMLLLEGYEVHAALSADDALRVLDARPVDAMIVDLVLPDVSGLDFIRLVRERNASRNTPVAVVTGNYFTDDTFGEELKALRVEVRYKPLWLEDLTKLAHELLNDA